MSRRYVTHVREVAAIEFSLQVKQLEDYKDAWLVINNNARTYPEDIYKVSNDSGDRIYVLCNPETADSTKSFLGQFGTITNEDREKVAVFVDVSCDYSNFDEDYIDSEYILGEVD